MDSFVLDFQLLSQLIGLPSMMCQTSIIFVMVITATSEEFIILHIGYDYLDVLTLRTTQSFNDKFFDFLIKLFYGLYNSKYYL